MTNLIKEKEELNDYEEWLSTEFKEGYYDNVFEEE